MIEMSDLDDRDPEKIPVSSLGRGAMYLGALVKPFLRMAPLIASISIIFIIVNRDVPTEDSSSDYYFELSMYLTILSMIYLVLGRALVYLIGGIFSVALMVMFFLGALLSLLGPENFFTSMNFFVPGEGVAENAQQAFEQVRGSFNLEKFTVLMAVIAGGGFGGCMRILVNERDHRLNFVVFLQASFTGLFVSFVLFLVLRAGIIDQDSVDTFNVWGVCGISMLAGYFSGNALQRLNSVFSELVAPSEKNPD